MAPLPFTTRVWFAWVCFFRVLFDGVFAAKVFHPELPEKPPLPEQVGAELVKSEPVKAEPVKAEPVKAEPTKNATEDVPAPVDAALQLLALLQREGRLVDFLEEDVASFSDADIGAAARVVHSGCRKALREHVKLEPIRGEDEGAKVTVDASPALVKLTGNVQGKGPHTGTLRHRGWKAIEIKLPAAMKGHDAHVVAQAEIEL